MQNNVYVVDCRYAEIIEKAFGDAGVFLPSVPCFSLQEPVSCHPDMTLYPAGDGHVVCAPSVFAEYSALLSPFGRTLVQGKAPLSKDYPQDVAYNVLNVGLYAFARWDCVDTVLQSTVKERGIRLVTVAQGYSRCSALTVGNGVITADASIAKAVEEAGFSVLKIRPGHISLPGYAYGFIGGASGMLNEKTVAVFGDLDFHPDGEAIRRFIFRQGFALREMKGAPLTDVGTILRV